MPQFHVFTVLTILASFGVCLAQESPGLVIQTVAGTPRDNGDGGPAAQATLHDPEALAFDRKGTLYIADGVTLRAISPDGLIRTVAGTDSGDTGYCPQCTTGDGGPAVYAPLTDLHGIAVDDSGNIYFSDRFHGLQRKISPAGILSTVKPMSAAWAVAVDRLGNIYVSSWEECRVYKVSPDGTVQVFAGTGEFGFSGDNGPATGAHIGPIVGLVFDPAGNLYLADYWDRRVRKVTPAGIISTVAGDGTAGFGGDGALAVAAPIGRPQSVASDNAGNLYITSFNEDSTEGRVFRVDSASGVLHTIAVTVAGETISAVPFRALAVDRNDVLYLADANARRILKVAADGSATLVAGAARFRGDGGPATAALLSTPATVLEDPSGNLFIADSGNHRIRRVSTDGVIRTVAGTGVAGFNGDGADATQFQLSSPHGLAFDLEGNLLIADAGNQRIRKLTPAGVLSTVAGTGTAGYSGDGGPAASAQLNAPGPLAVASDGSVFIGDTGNFRIRKIDREGVITSAAGTGQAGSTGDGAPATEATIGGLSDLAIDASNNLYLAQFGNPPIRKIDAGGIITTVTVDPLGSLQSPAGLAVDASGTLYVAAGANRICTVDAAGKVTTIAGGYLGQAGSFGDGTAAAYAQLYFPLPVGAGVSFGKDGRLFIADSGNHLIRVLQPAQVYVKSVTNAASFQLGPVVPGEYVSIFGTGIGPASPVTSSSLDLVLGETRVLFDGKPSPLRYVSSTQINAVVPYAVEGKTATQIQVEYQGKTLATVSAPVGAAAPGVFQSAIINQDGRFNAPNVPAAPGSIITFFATGTGQTDPPGVDAQQPQAPLFPKPLYSVAVILSGQAFGEDRPAAEVLFAGQVYPGVVQLNVRLPAALPSSLGNYVDFNLLVAGISAQPNLGVFVQ